MSKPEAFDYYLRFAEVTEQLVEALSESVSENPTVNQSLDKEMQKALWVTHTLIRRWRETASIGFDQAEEEVEDPSNSVSEPSQSRMVVTRFARKL